MFLLAISLVLLTTCGGVSSNVLAPTVVEYSAEVQAQAAKEMLSLPEPCPRDTVYQLFTPERGTHLCSAVVRLTIDYRRMRKQIRVIEESTPGGIIGWLGGLLSDGIR